jgi:cytoplasmic iron level regulating protein YaaA (DUF328/UPF0246 family)
MKILLAPSEAKSSGGVDDPITSDSFVFANLFDKREHIIDSYNQYVSSLDIDGLKAFFGLKKESDVIKYQNNPILEPTKKAILRYSGIAYDAIEYSSLDDMAQKYIDDNVIIFSNLFGPIKASDTIPDYKYKQGAKLPDISVEKFYKDSFSEVLDEYLGDDIIDLRAGYYDKFYKIKANYLTFKFLKNGKVVSHYAKKYRGILLKEIATHNAQTKDDVLDINFPSLKLKEIIRSKNKEEIVFDVIE